MDLEFSVQYHHLEKAFTDVQGWKCVKVGEEAIPGPLENLY